MGCTESYVMVPNPLRWLNGLVDEEDAEAEVNAETEEEEEDDEDATMTRCWGAWLVNFNETT